MSSGYKVEFGVFELDLRAGELRKNGVRIKLEQQPFQVLALLLNNPGEIVTREQLKEALWADDTFVDFDNGLNTAIRKIRRVLDDSATTPRYIETLPKRGYRFISPVESGARAAAETSAVKPERVQSRVRWAGAVVAAILAIVVVVLAFRSPETIATDARTEQPTIVPLTSLPGIEQHPTFSPDGSQVAFSWNGEDRENFDIYVKPVFGGEPPLRLTDHPTDDIMPAWSPDGQTIAFWRSNGNQSGIFLVSPLGGNQRKLFDDRPPIADSNAPWSQLSWSADAKWLAYTDTRSSPAPIAAVSIVTGEERFLTEASEVAGGVGDLFPAFSPDGKQLAWSRSGVVGLGTSGVFTMSLADRKPRRQAQLNAVGVAWTGDSRSLIITKWKTNLVELNLAHRTKREIPNSPLAVQPAVPRTGERVAYATGLPNGDVLRVDLTPGSLEPAAVRTISASTRLELAPQISPDGSRVALSSWRSGARRLMVAQADGSNAVEIAPEAAASRWSPDGRYIAYDRRMPEGGYGIYIVDAEGGAPRLLVDPPASHASQPCWSEDGQTIYFNLRHAGDIQIWKKPVAGGGGPLQVTQGNGRRCWVSGGLVYFTRGDDIWRVPENGKGQEELILKGCLFSASGHWQVAGEFLHFIDFEEGLRSGRWALKRMDLSSREIVDVVELPREPGNQNGLSVAPDESWFVYVVDNTTEQDLMMMENFR